MRKYNSTIVVVIFLLSTVLITSAHPVSLYSVTVSSGGAINLPNGHIPAGLTLKYSTDFETVTRSGTRPGGSLNLGNDVNGVPMTNSWYFEHSSGGSVEETDWIEVLELDAGIGGHNSARSIALQTGTGTVAGKRVEFNIDLQNHFEGNLYGKILYMSKWMYIPTGMNFPPSGSSWASLGFTLDSGTYTSGTGVQIGCQYWSSGDAVVTWNFAPSGPVLGWVSKPWVLPKGVWWKLEVLVYFHPTNGTFRVWFDGILVEALNQRTIGYDGQSLYSTVFKNYHEDVAPICTTYFDDLEIYGT